MTRRLRIRFLTVALCLLPFALCLPAGRAQQPSRGYEGAFRYPSVVPAVIENLAVVNWRERMIGVPQPPPGASLALPDPPTAPGTAHLLAGVTLPPITVPP